MKNVRAGIVLSACNLILLVVFLARDGSTTSEPVPTTLRGNALELVDTKGVVRASIDMAEEGEVVFRLRDNTGTIRVKIGAATDGSGIVLLDGDTEPGVHIVAGKDSTRLVLKDKSGVPKQWTP